MCGRCLAEGRSFHTAESVSANQSEFAPGFCTPHAKYAARSAVIKINRGKKKISVTSEVLATSNESDALVLPSVKKQPAPRRFVVSILTLCPHWAPKLPLVESWLRKAFPATRIEYLELENSTNQLTTHAQFGVCYLKSQHEEAHQSLSDHDLSKLWGVLSSPENMMMLPQLSLGNICWRLVCDCAKTFWSLVSLNHISLMSHNGQVLSTEVEVSIIVLGTSKREQSWLDKYLIYFQNLSDMVHIDVWNSIIQQTWKSIIGSR